MKLTDSQIATFWGHIRVHGHCWIWAGHTSKEGYGLFYFNGKIYLAHRIILHLNTGQSTDEGIVKHTCENRACCNPSHLRTYESIKQFNEENSISPWTGMDHSKRRDKISTRSRLVG